MKGAKPWLIVSIFFLRLFVTNDFEGPSPLLYTHKHRYTSHQTEGKQRRKPASTRYKKGQHINTRIEFD